MSSPNGTAPPPDQSDSGITSQTDIAVISGVIAAVAFVLVCLLFVLLCYQCRHKGVYYTNEGKGSKFAEDADVALGDDSSRKEYFI
ncbi:glycophorin-C [Dasypus novemcinctus]|uniref:glycophorin-C n=1 Tax=Dasypus novemcinctus TaxID=9361 RepID=UPI00265F45C5|nr:glycophorin-C [Dasypus novemcinctus]